MSVEENTDSDSSTEPSEPSFLEKHGERIVKRLKKRGRLYEHQLIALEKVIKWFDNPATANKTAVVSMPTGSGKTGVICCLPYYFGKYVASKKLEAGIDLKKPILVIAPGKVILRQLIDNLVPRDNNTFLIKRGIFNERKDPGRASTSNVSVEEVQRYHYMVNVINKASDIAPLALCQYQICLVNSQKGHTKSRENIYTWNELDQDSFSVVIVDEAHHLPSKTWKDIISRFEDHAKVVFFTATPFRSDKKKITEDIHSTGLAYHVSRRDAVEKGIIRDTNPIDLEQVAGSRYVASESLQKAKDLLPKIKMRLEEKNRDQPLPGGTKHMAILCASSIADAEKICFEWNNKYSPLTASVIHSEMREHPQKLFMCNLKDGKLTLIIIVQMLLEGFDHPPISVAAIATKISSPVKFAQFIGRAQRVYRSPDGEVEPDGIKADIISDGFFKQNGNYKKFVSEELIRIEEVEEDEEETD